MVKNRYFIKKNRFYRCLVQPAAIRWLRHCARATREGREGSGWEGRWRRAAVAGREARIRERVREKALLVALNGRAQLF